MADEPAAGQPAEETVGVLLEEARWVFDDERRHGQTLDARLGLLAAFAGLILVLGAPGGYFGGGVVTGSVRYVLEGLDIAYAVLLAASVVLAVSPWARRTLGRFGADVAAAPWRWVSIDSLAPTSVSDGLVAESAVEVERRMLATLAKAIEEQGRLNQMRWRVFRLVATGVAAALVAFAAQAIIVVFAV